ncbi:MarR family transcriptional regulator [Lunatibacter salilacus]|uniref:MarR family transcriptional regulator n=1 Tax=Lunatibacter salilacus TaxID=2483804 RepID=UPI003742C351
MGISYLRDKKGIQEGIFTVVLSRTSKSSEKNSEKSSESGSEQWLKTKATILEKVNFKINKSQWKILRIIIDRPQSIIQEMADQIGLSTRAIEKNLEKLKAADLVVRTGSDISGIWTVKIDSH